MIALEMAVKPTKNFNICSLHFEEHNLKYTKKGKMLKPNASPTKNLPKKSFHKEIKVNFERKNRIEVREQIKNR